METNGGSEEKKLTFLMQLCGEDNRVSSIAVQGSHTGRINYRLFGRAATVKKKVDTVFIRERKDLSLTLFAGYKFFLLLLG